MILHLWTKWRLTFKSTYHIGSRALHVMNYQNSSIRAVIFDMGGVLIPSPGRFFADFESRMQIPTGTLVRTILASGDDGAWSKLERGEIEFCSFGEKFSEECFKQTNLKLDTGNLLSQMVEYFSQGEPFPEMIYAIERLRSSGIKTALLTNNFLLSNKGTYLPLRHELFDVIIESAKAKMRKPEHRIYERVLQDLHVSPPEAVFLDDLGHNLKAAKEMGIQTIKVENTDQALSELEKYVFLELRDVIPGTVEVPNRLKIDVDRLENYLKKHLDLFASGKPTLRCFEQGLSNPTYLLTYGGRHFVLRKKPPGKLLSTAHDIEREYKIFEALKNTDVPVPKMICLCSDESVLGTPFFLMEYIDGVIFNDPMLPGLSPGQKKKVMTGLSDTLHKLHNVNYIDVGLEKLGGKGSYLSRNLNRWWKQYESSKCDAELKSMSLIHQWLQERLPEDEKVTLIHGDYRLDNLIYDRHTFDVRAVIDWELSTLGDPLTDLAGSGIIYFAPSGNGFFKTLDVNSPDSEGLPTLDEYLQSYFRLSGTNLPKNWEFYLVFIHFRMASILQGVYKRFLTDQASSAKAHNAFSVAQIISDMGWDIAQKSNLPPSYRSDDNASGQEPKSPVASSQFGLLPVSVESLSPRARSTFYKVKEFVDRRIIPLEKELIGWYSDPATKWTIHPKIGELKTMAKEEGLWNLFVPVESDPESKYGKGFSNVEYAFMAEEMGKSLFAPEIFNCSAPDTGNMEVLVRYGSEEQKKQWLSHLLDGSIRSCFAMTEPGVASSDATNIKASIKREGNEYVINGHKWWTSGALDPRCKLCIFMGKTNEQGKPYQQQSMIIIPMDAPGVKVVRPLLVFGFDDAPHGHAEVLFENVRVPVSNLILGEGRGFEIAQGRLGPGRIHHCMRILGALERCIQLMLDRTLTRNAFGKPLIEHGSIQDDVAQARIKIEQARLLVLKAAHMMDTSGNKAAALEIAMIKAIVPEIGCEVIDRAIQAFGGMGVCQDVVLPQMYIMARSLCIADGPTEVHLRTIAKMELKKFTSRM